MQIREPAWGQRELDFVCAYLKPRNVFVDVGAGLGHFTVEAASIVGPAGLVLAVEPSPIRASYLARSTQNADNVRIARAFAAFMPHGQDDDEPAPKRHLDGLLDEHAISAVDLLRVDAAGALIDVLRGASGLLGSTTFVGPVVLHIDRDELAAAGRHVDELNGFFPPGEWADSTGLRLGSYDPHGPRFTRIYERR